MKRIVLAIATVFTAAAPAAFAQYDRYDSRYDNSRYDNNRYDARDYRDNRDNRDYRDNRYETARVIESRPVYASSKEECFNPRTGSYDEVRDSHTSIGKGAAIGAVAGGVLGHQVDHGGGTAAGAILGGILGHQLERRADRDDQDLDRSRCRVASYGGPVEGYDVRYEFQGRQFVARMPNDPGRRLYVGRELNPDGTAMDSAGRNLDPNHSGG